MNKLARQVKQASEIIGVSPFNKGDFVVFVKDFMTAKELPPREVMFPAGTKAWVVSVESDAIRVDIAGSGDRRYVDSDELEILQLIEPDDFDRAWLSHDYATARSMWDAKQGTFNHK